METTHRANAEGGHRHSLSRRISLVLLVTIVLLSLLVASGLLLAGCSFEFGTRSDTTSTSQTVTTQSNGGATATTVGATNTTTSAGASAGTVVTAGQGMASPAEAVGQILAASVVNIAVSDTTTQSGPFGGQFDFQAEGSGVIYTSDGMIITNNHVVTNEYTNEAVSDITVTLTTGEELPATIVGRDPLTDLAVIKVNSVKPLPAATFNTEIPKVGEYAVAIGSPLGFSNSVTLGIVSALDRSLDVSSYTGEVVTYFGLIQTDTPISPGNSGGALANASGQVIGINAVKSDQSGAEGIGFAIPSSIVTMVADQIIKTGRATHAYMGVGTRAVTEDLQQQFSLSRSSGILIASVTQNGPAAKAGIQRGDIVVQIDGKDMVESSDLLQAIRDKQPGDQVKVTLDRNGQSMDVTVTLEERPAELSTTQAAG
jgi:S1-C subfamily serine protease